MASAPQKASLVALAAKPQVKMIEIKLSQGAKPGKGGILPAAKITPEIAAIRGIPMGKDSRHYDIGNVTSIKSTAFAESAGNRSALRLTTLS